MPESKILVVGPSWAGDMVMAQSLFITLKKAQPDCQIDVLAPAWSFPLLDRMPEVRNAIAMPLSHGQFGLLDRIKLGKSLRANNYQQAIVLPNSWKSALIPYFANIPIRTGYIGECRWGLLNDARKLDKTLLTMTVQRFVALGLPNNPNCVGRVSDSVTRPIEADDAKNVGLRSANPTYASGLLPPEYPIPKLVINQNQQEVVIDKFKLNANCVGRVSDSVNRHLDADNHSSTKILALCPGAEYGPAKRWPASYYAEVAQHKINLGWQVWLFGSDKDKDAAAQINSAVSGACLDFTGRTSLDEAVDLMSLVDVVVSNDSGLMHVAAALDKKTIALYGSSDPNFTPPLNTKAEVITLNLECSPCFKRECPLGHTRCLTDIKPQQVLDSIELNS
ncbi:MAG: lipopolysaccharide heptosyltransferase II [Methylococcales bacterium]|nr:MAG: lipopolysaccharide heptosyltransferase II [Methylococcales bacterium]